MHIQESVGGCVGLPDEMLAGVLKEPLIALEAAIEQGAFSNIAYQGKVSLALATLHQFLSEKCVQAQDHLNNLTSPPDEISFG